MKARSAKAKGARLEKEIARRLADIGAVAPWRKEGTKSVQPGSGAIDGWDHDVEGYLPDGPFIVECKSRKEQAWRTGDRWIGYNPKTGHSTADCLIVKCDGVNQHDNPQPMVYMPWAFFERLVGLANGDRDIDRPRPAAKHADSAGDRSWNEVMRELVDAPPERIMERPREPGKRYNAPQSLLTGEPKPKPKPNKWPRRKK